MNKDICAIILLCSVFSPLAAKEKITVEMDEAALANLAETVPDRDAETYVEEIVIDDLDLDDFAEERKDDPPPKPKDLSLPMKVLILIRIIANVTADWYNEHIKPKLMRLQGADE